MGSSGLDLKCRLAAKDPWRSNFLMPHFRKDAESCVTILTNHIFKNKTRFINPKVFPRSGHCLCTQPTLNSSYRVYEKSIPTILIRQLPLIPFSHLHGSTYVIIWIYQKMLEILPPAPSRQAAERGAANSPMTVARHQCVALRSSRKRDMLKYSKDSSP